MKWLKRLCIVAFVFVVLGFIGILILGLGLNHAVKSGVESGLPPVTGTPVTLGESDLSVFSGGGALRSFVIGAPAGFEKDPFRLDSIDVRVRPMSVFDEVVVVDQIVIDGAQIVIELTKDGASNLAVIQERVQPGSSAGFGLTQKDLRSWQKKLQQLQKNAATGDSSAGQGSEASREDASAAQKVAIQTFLLRNSKVEVSGPLLGEQEITFVMPELQLSHIGGEVDADGTFVSKEHGVTTREATAQIFRQLIPLLSKNMAANAQGMEILKGQGVALWNEHGKRIFGEEQAAQVEGLTGEILKGIDDKAVPPEAGKAIRSLFGGDASE